MHAFRFGRPLDALLCLAIAGSLAGQNSPLNPTADTTIVVTNTPLHYSLIHVPVGVTVRFVAPGGGPLSTPGMPAVLFCDGDAIVEGTLSVEGNLTNVFAAGWVATGEGEPGSQCTSSLGPGWYFRAEGGRHAGDYGSAVPFSLDGGSFGGDFARYGDSQGVIWCGQLISSNWGGEPGGTLALIAEGRIEVSGSVTADGNHDGESGGSGGSILLRSKESVTILPTGSVTARGGAHYSNTPSTYGAPGYVRIEAWGAPPDIQGTVVPVPTVLELPLLRVVNPPQIGGLSAVHVYAPESTTVFVSASLLAGPGTTTPFGILGIDPGTAAPLGFAFIYSLGDHDPRARLQWPIPNSPGLVGLHIWLQGAVFSSALTPRLTNTVPVVVN